MMSELLVKVQNAGRIYKIRDRQVEALLSASCEVALGSRIAVTGPSGSGKSTLLHLMGGLDAPTSGSVTWPLLGGPKGLRPALVGFVFQMPSLLPSLDVLENVKLPLVLMGCSKDNDARAMEILQRFGLDTLARKLPDELSGGQLQRVAMARALVAGPRFILADEPTGQLDHPTAKALLDALLEFIEGTDTALIVATHDNAVAERMDTRWSIRHGILEEYNL
jgi:ABC-type lipoprotein export system ATPase subunit